MTDHVARLYALAVGALVFLVTWAVVAANPFPTLETEADPRLAALERREARLAREQRRTNRLVARRFAAYRRELADHRRLQAALDAAAAASPAAAASSSSGSSSGSGSAPAAVAAPPPAVQVTSSPPVTSSGSS
jgi:hypothetical protein